jgi:hypothetical protein
MDYCLAVFRFRPDVMERALWPGWGSGIALDFNPQQR